MDAAHERRRIPVRAGPRQLALALNHEESFAREDFLSGPSNAAALALIECWPQWPNRAMILTGPEGSGKSHLAAVWANAAGARRVAGRALEQATVPAMLATGALVIEDLAAGAFDERALFHLLNLAHEDEAFLLLTARTVPTAWKMNTPVENMARPTTMTTSECTMVSSSPTVEKQNASAAVRRIP